MLTGIAMVRELKKSGFPPIPNYSRPFCDPLSLEIIFIILSEKNLLVKKKKQDMGVIFLKIYKIWERCRFPPILRLPGSSGPCPT
jgi:hypothetical protein